MIVKDISFELYREYDFGGRVYRIENVKTLQYHEGGATHRIVTQDGVVHCVPAPGKDGCVLRLKNKKGAPRVAF